MKTPKKIISILSAICISMLAFTGCSDKTSEHPEQAEPYNLAVVLGKTNNQPVYDSTAIDEITALAKHPNSHYAFILSDGEPNIILDGKVPDFSAKNYSEDTLKRAQASITAAIDQEITNTIPDDDEVDIAKAISLAARTLQTNADDSKENIMLLHTSGISTAGSINFTQTPISALDINNSVASVASQLNVDLNEVTVICYFLGDVTAPQDPLSDDERIVLSDFYKRLFETLGAKDVIIKNDLPAGNDSYAFDQSVTTMPVEGSTSALQASVVDATAADTNVENILSTGKILSYDETALTFKADSTELTDPFKAQSALTSVVDFMLKNQDSELLICGCTSSASDKQTSLTFSEGRAEKIRDLLVEAGIENNRLHILGCGYSSAVLYTPDRDDFGDLIESKAATNRAVRLVDYNSDASHQIMSSLSSQT